MVSEWMPDEDLLNHVLDGISDVKFSDVSEAELSVHEESESEEEGTAGSQFLSDSGNSDVHTDDNGMFFFCLQCKTPKLIVVPHAVLAQTHPCVKVDKRLSSE